jgi:tetratricopeptide (TPR) repeat protein
MPPNPPNRVELLCLRAQEAIAARDWEKARQFYLLALEFRADSAEVHYGLATVLFQLRDMTNAAHHFYEVIRLEPTRTRAYFNLGAALHQLGDLEDAETALCKGLQLDGRRGEGFYLLGLVRKSKGQLDKALVNFAEALRCNQRLADAHLGMGEVYVLKNQPDTALTCYEQALRLRPNWERALAAQQEAQTLLSRKAASKSEGSAAEQENGLARIVDPETDRAFLTELHQATSVAEQHGLLLHKLLAEQVSPLLVELSRLLVNPKSLRSDLGTCLARFETTVERICSARQALAEQLRKIEEIGSRLPK